MVIHLLQRIMIASERRGRRPRWVSANPGSGRRPRWGLCEPWIRSSPSFRISANPPTSVMKVNSWTNRPGSQQVQQRHLFDASRSSREAVASACIRSTTRPKANRLRTTHATRDGPCGHVFATILGREPRVAAGPFSGQVGPGSPHSPSRLERGSGRCVRH